MLDAAQIAGLNCLRLMNETTAGWYKGFCCIALQVFACLVWLEPTFTLITKLYNFLYSCISIWNL